MVESHTISHCERCGAKAEVVYTYPSSSDSRTTTTGSTLVSARVRCTGCATQTAEVRIWSSSPRPRAVDDAKAQVARYATRLWNSHDLAGAVPDLVFWLHPDKVVLGAEISISP
jgi:hypothetical protein